MKGFPTEELRGQSALLDKSVSFWGDRQFQHGFGKDPRDICIGGNEKGLFEIGENFGSEKRNAIEMATSQLGDVLISG